MNPEVEERDREQRHAQKRRAESSPPTSHSAALYEAMNMHQDDDSQMKLKIKVRANTKSIMVLSMPTSDCAQFHV